MKKLTFLLVFALSVSVISCARPHLVKNPEVAYESLGTLELRVPTDRTITKYLTLGLLRKHSYAGMTRKLDKALSKEARGKYGADAVANVTYWPEPGSSAAGEYLYGRGEMIRYKKFPATDYLLAPDPDTAALPT